MSKEARGHVNERNAMKAKFGKLSLASFIAQFIFFFLLAMGATSGDDSLIWVTLLIFFLFTLLGFIFALLVLMKKEMPKAYWIIGLF